MPKAHWRILIVAALCVAALVAMVVRETMARDSGQEVLLPMAAIDPRTLLSGHYVTIDLREQLPADVPCEPPPLEFAWLALAPSGEQIAGSQVYSLFAAAEHRELVPTTPRALLVRGTSYCQPPTPSADPAQPRLPGVITLDLGIDRFYINQRDAERIDRVLRDQTPADATRVYAIVSIGDDGRARLKGLVVDGERLELNWL